jgi:hypothetical protein
MTYGSVYLATANSGQGILIKTLMHDYGLSKVSVYRYLRVSPAS